MVICGLNVFGILVKTDEYQLRFHADDLNVVYFGSKMNINDKKYHAGSRNKRKKYVFLLVTICNNNILRNVIVYVT